MSNVKDVVIDCGGRLVESTGPMPNSGSTITANAVSRLSIRNCRVLGSIAFNAVQDSDVTNNHIAGSYTQNNSSRVRFSGNGVTFDPAKPSASGIVSFIYPAAATPSSGIRWTAHGTETSQPGANRVPTMGFSSPTRAVTSSRTTRSATRTNAGIEGVGILKNTLIATNAIANIGYAGIGSYHGTNWTSNVVRGNQVSQSPSLACIEFTDNQQSAQINTAIFQNNLFEETSSAARLPGRPRLAARFRLRCSSAWDPPAAFPVIVGNNVIRNNVLGQAGAGMTLFPASAFSQWKISRRPAMTTCRRWIPDDREL